jgi:hypothetical protein
MSCIARLDLARSRMQMRNEAVLTIESMYIHDWCRPPL